MREASKYLKPRGKTGIFWLRMRVPSDLVAIVGKQERTHSTGTSDRRQAEVFARRKLAEWDREYLALRSRQSLTIGDMKAAAAQYYREERDRDEIERSTVPSASLRADAALKAKHDIQRRKRAGEIKADNPIAEVLAELDHPALVDQRGFERASRRIRLRELEKHLAENEHALISHAADAFLARHSIVLDAESKEYRQLCHYLLHAEIELLKRQIERDSGNFGGSPTDPIIAAAPDSSFSILTFDDVIDAQEQRSKRGMGTRKSAATFRKYRTIIGQFVKWRDSNRVDTVTKAEADRWCQELLEDDQSPKTVRDKLGGLRAVLGWAQRQSDGKLFEMRNPLDTLELPAIEERDSGELTYTLDKAREILIAARSQDEPHRRWLPWLLAYSGARVGELMQLTGEDVFQVGDDWFFHIRVGKGRSTKTHKARRVPIHPALIDEGFLGFVESSRGARLFTAARAEQNLRDWIREEFLSKMPLPRPAPCHGFRHLFEDLRRFRLDQEAANYITGRANKRSEDLYGKSDAMLPKLAEQMRQFPRIIP